jgi:hypothetical protein
LNENEHEHEMKRKKESENKGKERRRRNEGTRPLIIAKNESLKGSSDTIKRENKKMCENKKRKEDDIEEVITNLIREHIR